MWTRELLKTRAKGVLKSNYWMTLFAVFIYMCLAGTAISVAYSFYYISMFAFIGGPGVAILVILLTIVFTLCSVFAALAFVANPIYVGMCRFLMESRHGKADVGMLFWAFNKGRYMKVVKTMFFYTLYIFLWSLLFTIPGIIKLCQYYYVPFIVAENPEIDSKRVLELSTRMTNGEKWSIFVLDLSFIGWWILGYLACCIGLYFLYPYIYATKAELYAFVRERSIYNGLTTSYELAGFGYVPAWQPPLVYPNNPTAPPVAQEQASVMPPIPTVNNVSETTDGDNV